MSLIEDMETLFPHTTSFDHFEAQTYEERCEDDGPNHLTRLGEHLPIFSSALQILYEFANNESALIRARRSDPIGPDGVLTKAAEYVPVVNLVVQEIHRSGDEDEALERARQRNPIGSEGYLTKMMEHIPLVSDGMVAFHRYHEDELAAERARGYSLERLLSKDGAITRVAELLPGSNLFAAAFHKINGDSERMERALNLVESWSALSEPDSGLWQVAELVPGVDAFAFAVHLNGGHYAQALRSVTKTSWVNVQTREMTFFIRFNSVSERWCEKVDILDVDVLPRQFSLVVGLSDVVTNFLRIDPKGQRRDISDPEAAGAQSTAMDLSKELVKGVVSEKLKTRVDYIMSMVPTYADWLVEFLGSYLLPKYQQESLAWRVLSPQLLPPISNAQKEELQRAFPNVTARYGPLRGPGPIRQKRRCPSCATPCLSLAAVASACGLGKVGLGACAVGCLAGLADLGRSAMRHVVQSVSEGNAARWQSMVVEPQPPQPTAPAPAPAPAPAAAGSSDCASPRSPDISTTASSSPPPEESSPSGRGVVLELPAADVERLGPHALDFLEAAACPSRGWWGTLGQVLGRRWLFSSLRGVVDELTLVVPVDLDPWEVTWDFSQNLKLPSMRFAVVLHLDVSASCRFSRVSAAFPKELTLNVARCLQEQIQQWDLREIDPRFAGFTQPARVTFDLEAEWISQQMLRLTTKNLGSRLDLPAS